MHSAVPNLLYISIKLCLILLFDNNEEEKSKYEFNSSKVLSTKKSIFSFIDFMASLSFSNFANILK